MRWLTTLALAGAPLLPLFALWYADRRSAPSVALGLEKSALVALEAGRAGEAASLLERAARRVPNPRLLTELGRALVRAGRSAEAERAFDRAVAIDPELPEPRLRRAWLRLGRVDAGEGAGSREDLAPAASVERARVDAAWLATAERRGPARDLGESIALLRYRLASRDLDLGAATRAAEAALAINPRSSAAIVARAEVSMGAADLSRAREVLETGLALLGERAPARMRVLLARVLEDMGEPRRSDRAAAGPATEGGAPAPPLGGDHARAAAEQRARLAADPFDRTARLELARVLAVAGDVAPALVEIGTLIRHAPGDPEPLRLGIALRARSGRLAEAAALVRELPGATEAPEDSRLAIGWLALCGPGPDDAPTRRGPADTFRARQARRSLEELSDLRRSLGADLGRLAPGESALEAAAVRLATSRGDIARAYAKLGLAAPLERDLRSALSSRPDLPEGWMALASILEEARDLEGAVCAAEAACALRPQDLSARAILARCLLAEGKAGRALELCERPAGLFEIARDVSGRRGIGIREGRGPNVQSPYVPLRELEETGFRAAVELGCLDRAAQRFAALRTLEPGTPVAPLAAAAVALGRDAEAELLIAGPLASADPGQAPEPGANLLAAVLAIARGKAAHAVRRAELADARGSIERTVILVNARLIAGDREGAAAAVGAALDPPPSLLGPSRSRDRILDAAPEAALRSYAATLPDERLAAVAVPLDRLIVAAAFGFRAPARRLASELVRGASDVPLVPLIAARALSRVGAETEARDALERAASGPGAALETRYALLLALARAREWKRAAAVLEGIIDELARRRTPATERGRTLDSMGLGAAFREAIAAAIEEEREGPAAGAEGSREQGCGRAHTSSDGAGGREQGTGNDEERRSLTGPGSRARTRRP